MIILSLALLKENERLCFIDFDWVYLDLFTEKEFNLVSVNSYNDESVNILFISDDAYDLSNFSLSDIHLFKKIIFFKTKGLKDNLVDLSSSDIDFIENISSLKAIENV